MIGKVEIFTEAESRAAIAWMVGEYGDHIKDADIILRSYFVDSFEREEDVAKLQILTACVKMYLKQPTKCEEEIKKVLKFSNE